MSCLIVLSFFFYCSRFLKVRKHLIPFIVRKHLIPRFAIYSKSQGYKVTNAELLTYTLYKLIASQDSEVYAPLVIHREFEHRARKCRTLHKRMLKILRDSNWFQKILINIFFYIDYIDFDNYPFQVGKDTLDINSFRNFSWKGKTT